ncbi:MAG: tRNA (adenosine(37)-N6)-threonylcarbamoyltransferase complex ATPase subunit type 1 TsaE [Candidatus Sericytochromatia bacterium]|nr:tRNA (adenosine(37)-N6)-threonylcarbamoyltransferase complex ATPase subunit type 1 TsaE [Candidatus Sericytochromatia bacterium]
MPNLPIHFSLSAPHETHQWGALLAKYTAQLPSVWLLNGELGSGKTTFVQGLAAGLGITERLTSPTFALVHEYQTPQALLLFHFDLYRLGSAEEVFELGLEDYLRHPHSLCLFEWAERFPEIFPADCLKIQFRHAEPGRSADLYLPDGCAMLETVFKKDWQLR